MLVTGHERDPDASITTVARGGKAVQRAVSDALALAELPVIVIPMTLGRAPGLVADAARALRWLARGDGAGRVALTDPFGT
ncbi:cobalamin biosynthesis protein CbiX, partial [Streptomyces violascens]